MTDKERILTMLVKNIYMGALYSPDKVRRWRENQPPFMSINVGRKLEEGDLVIAFTTIEPNDFMVGFIHTPPDENGTAVIREIGSDRLCNYSVLSMIGQYYQAFDKVKIGKLNYHPSDIHWGMFGKKAEALFQTLGVNYTIKDSLRAEMERA